ncbi:MAG: iron-sulfur cluster assembly scaffold protein [Candidatus Gracilibacteria bacterium]|nr:iron-sulfur cluster assembly scaffold protein [Candidatus Gracilibacteria bacterium]
MALYSEIITSYSKNPPNRFEMEDFSVRYNEESRLCGDTIEIFLKIENGIIKDYSFIGNTSIITTACASIFGESIIDLDISEVLDFDLNHIKSLVGEISPRRKYAATLGLLATHNAIHSYLKDGIIEDFTDVIR